MKRFFILFIALQSGLDLRSATLEMWISSFQDQVYYEKMAKL